MMRLALLLALSTLLAEQLGAQRCPNVAFVVHSNHKNDHVTTFMSETFLNDTNLIVVTGHDSFDASVGHRRRKLNLRRVNYDGNPGGMLKTFRTGGRKYLGTHRTMAGVLMAMDTFPESEWVYVLDDDNVVNADSICATLNSLNASIPLLLGQVGPRAGGHAPCKDSSSEDGTNFTCCQNVSRPCLANYPPLSESSVFVYDEDKGTMLPRRKCDFNKETECCNVVPWPEGIMYGYPYRLREPGDADAEVSFSSHILSLYPYGGATYALSKAMFEAVGRKNWEKYMYILQCTNADISIMTTIFNHGYSIHNFGGFHVTHHSHTVSEQFDAFKTTHQPMELYYAACNFPVLKNSTACTKL